MHQTRTRSDSLQFQRLTRQVGKVLELSHFICGNKRVKRRSSFAAIPIPPNSRKGSTFTPPVVSRRNSTPATPVLSSGDSKTDTTAPSDGDTMTYYEYGVSNMRIGLPAVEEQSQFDKDLRFRWDEAMENGVFRYDLSELQTKVIDGPHGYIGTLNTKRATDRRPPESMQSLTQPFDATRFNFNKIKSEEILMHIRQRGGDSQYRDKVIVNVSPGDYGHSLIIPQIDSNYNQNLTEHGIKLSLDIMCLSSSRSFRIGFNSLCAYASVNHQHLHCYYNNLTLPAEVMTASPFSEDLFVLDSDSPTGFAFELRDVRNISLLATKIFSCTDYMRRCEIAHSVFMTRGASFTDPSLTVIRVLLWPRKKVIGAKCMKEAFNSAVWEMAGHLLIKNKECYDSISDDSAYQCLKEACLPDDDFQRLTDKLVQITTDIIPV